MSISPVPVRMTSYRVPRLVVLVEIRIESAVCPSRPAPAEQAVDEVVKAQVAELAQVKVESTSRMPVKIFGVIHTHLFANSGAGNWLESPNLVDAPLPDGGGGTFSGSLRQTRLGFTVDGPSLGGARTSGVVAMDFFGGVPGFQTGQVMGLPRLLVAYAPFTKNVRYVALGEIPLCALAAGLVFAATRADGDRRGLAVAGSAVALLCIGGWLSFQAVFVDANLYDPMTASLLFLRGLAPQP